MQKIAWLRLVFLYDLAVNLSGIREVLIDHCVILRRLVPANNLDNRPYRNRKQHQHHEKERQPNPQLINSAADRSDSTRALTGTSTCGRSAESGALIRAVVQAATRGAA